MSDPVLATDGHGGVIVAWVGSPYDGLRNWTVRAQRLDMNGVPQWGPNGISLGQAAGDAALLNHLRSPAIAADGHGGAVVAWQSAFLMGAGGGRHGIYAQRVDADGNVLWVTGGVRSSGDTGPPSVACGADGSAFLTWFDIDSVDVRAQRIGPDGAVAWDSLGIVLAKTWGGQPLAVPNGDDGAIVVWDGGPIEDFDIHAQRLNTSGDRLWGADGVTVCDARFVQAFVCASSDGAGGALIAWQDWRTGMDYDVYAQRLSPDGAPIWLSNGVSICAAPDQQTAIDIVPDRGGGALIAWTDTRDGYPDPHVYAQAVDEQGAVRWAKNGLQVAASGVYPVIAPMKANRALIAWMAGPSYSSLNVYGQVVTPRGMVAQDDLEDPIDPGSHIEESPGQLAIDQSSYSGRISVQLAEQGPATLTVFDLSGRSVASHVMGAGPRERTFELERGLGSGVYFVRMQQGVMTVNRKIVLVR